MAKLRAIIFDFDGTIADTEPLHLKAFQQTLLQETEMRLTKEEYLERYIAFDDRHFFEAFFHGRGKEIPPKRFERLLLSKGQYYEKLAQNPPLFSGASDLIRAGATQWPLAIASGASNPEVIPVLGQAGLLKCFSAVVTAEMVKSGKPDPEPFRAALNRLNEERTTPILPDACLVVEDSIAGVTAGRTAGMRVIAVTNSAPRASLGNADRVVDSLEEIADVGKLGEWFESLS